MADWGKIAARGDVEDRRSLAPVATGVGGLGAVGLVVLIVANLLGANSTTTGVLQDVLTTMQQTQATRQTVDTSAFDGADSYETFVATVEGSTNDTWKAVFAQSNKQYNPPKLVLFRESTQSECGGATSEMGPHYCPNDHTIYLDETFFDELTQRLGAKGGDVAQAYVIAHEVGHHVQNELGIMDQADAATSGQAARDASIKLELQADCFAGVWAHAIADQGVMQPGEIAEAQDAAAAVGDDHIQKITQGRVLPETWTHGSSADRTKWFDAGYNSGKPSQCNTFGA